MPSNMDSELMRITNHDDEDNYKDNHGGFDEHIYDDNDENDE